MKVGDRCYDFVADSSRGGRFALAAHRGQVVVLYFFLRAIWLSRACVQQARRFRDNYPELKALGAEVVGVSTDDFPSTRKFALQHQVTFALVADEDHAISRAYGVLRNLLPIDKRVTFIIDEEGIVRALFHHEFQVSRHLDDVFRFVRQWRERPGGAGIVAPPP